MHDAYLKKLRTFAAENKKGIKKIKYNMEKIIVCTPAQLRAIIKEVIEDSASYCQEEEEELLTPKEVCSILGICPKTLQTLRDQRRIPFSQQGRKIWFKKSDIDSYLDRCRINSRR